MKPPARPAPSSLRRPLFHLQLLTFHWLLAAAALAAGPAPTIDTPVKNFRLPSFNEKGFRTSYLRAGEARPISPTQIDVKDMNLALFPGETSSVIEKAETVLVAPVATAFIDGKNVQVRGEESMRLITTDIDATGEKWRYERTDKNDRKLWIGKNVRVVFFNFSLGTPLK